MACFTCIDLVLEMDVQHLNFEIDDSRTLGVALVGCGWFAVRAHLPALQKLERTSYKALGFRVRLIALCSRSQGNIERASKRLDKQKLANIKTFLDLDEALACPLVDVIDLVLPIPEMPAAIERCLRAGKCVISEKPIAPSPEHLGELLPVSLAFLKSLRPCLHMYLHLAILRLY